MDQKIVGFHQDSESHWVADLACGHRQHVRHDPPMMERQWVLNSEERNKKIGSALNCKRCDEFGLVVAKGLVETCIRTVQAAYDEAGSAGLCEDGRVDLVIDRLKSLDVSKISEALIQDATNEFGTLS